MTREKMDFPKTWEEYEEHYGFNDSENVYTNGSRLIPSFRVKQWLDHLEQEPCEDAINRASAINAVSEALEHVFVENENVAKKIINKIPSVNPLPKTGHWTRELIRNEKGGCIGAKMICSECGKDNKHDEYMNYCPNCGCRMIEPQESEEV